MAVANMMQVANLKPFDGTGFSNWEFRLTLVLEQNGSLEAIEDNISETRVQEQEFKRKDVKARNIIVQWLCDNILETVKDKKTAREMYICLYNTYMKKGLATQVDLQRKLRSMKYEKGNLSDFINEFEKTVTELRSSGGIIPEEEVISQLLASMPEAYQSITTTIDVIFSQNPKDITYMFVKNRLLQEETRKTNESPIKSEAVTFMTKRGHFKGRHTGFRGNQRFGNQSRNRDYASNSETSQFRFNCYHCGKQGHKRSECPDRRRAYVADKEDEIVFITELEKDQAEEEKISIFDNVNDSVKVPSVISLMSKSNVKDEIVFIVDSGATNHLINKTAGQFLTETKEVNLKINVAKQGETILARKSGSLYVKNKELDFKMKDVLQCEDLKYNLMSVKRIESEGFKVMFEYSKVKILNRNSKTIIEGEAMGNLYIIRVQPQFGIYAAIDSNIMHKRMGHSSVYPSKTVCDVCLKGKQTRSQFKPIEPDKKAKRLLEVVSSDVAGPIVPVTHDEMKYYVTFIDHYSHFTHVYLIKNKSEVLEKFREYEALVTTKFQTKISRLRCDNGGEYGSNDFKAFCREKGIEIQYTIPRNPEQNGVSERFNRTVMNMARCLLLQSNLEKTFWGEAIRTAVYIINRLPTTSIEKQIPANIWYGYEVSTKNMRVFGSVGYVHVSKEDRRKLDNHSKMMIMIGYCANGYRMWDESKNKVVTAKSVIFDENGGSRLTEIKNEELGDRTEKANRERTVDASNNENQPEPENEENEGNKNGSIVRRSMRNRQTPIYLDDYETDVLEALVTGEFSIEENIPKCYTEAVEAGKEWQDAILEELKAHEIYQTWEIVEKLENTEIIDYKLLFQEHGSSERCNKKARLKKARRFLQSGEEEVYDPNDDPDLVAKMLKIKVLLAMVVEKNLCLNQLDFKCAFLNGVLEKLMYMYPP